MVKRRMYKITSHAVVADFKVSLEFLETRSSRFELRVWNADLTRS